MLDPRLSSTLTALDNPSLQPHLLMRCLFIKYIDPTQSPNVDPIWPTNGHLLAHWSAGWATLYGPSGPMSELNGVYGKGCINEIYQPAQTNP